MIYSKFNLLFLTSLFVITFSTCKDKAPVIIPEEAITLSVVDLSIEEGVSEGVVEIEVTISANRTKEVTLFYETIDGTAVGESDYVPLWGEQLIFPAGMEKDTQVITIELIDNPFFEEDETFQIRFFDIVNASINNPSVHVTILNDDAPHDTFPGYTTPLEYDGMTLIWQDEFNEFFDAGKWTHAIGTGCPDICGWGNNELEYYRAENTLVENGLLTITAKEESFEGSNYTSSRLLSEDKFEFHYGRIDIRARMPRGKGIWPALWMLGANISEVGWPKSGEIDIMEMRGSDPTKVCGVLHYQNNGGGHQNTGAECYSASEQHSYHEEFHVFSIIWNEYKISWYVDDQLYNTEFFNQLNLGSQDNPFQQDFYFLLNVAVGGNYDGNPNAATTFPQKMDIDYIRVFQ